MPKGSQKATQVHPKVALGAKVDFGSRNGRPPESFWEPFWSIFDPKTLKKTTSKNHLKFDTEKSRENERKNTKNGAEKGAKSVKNRNGDFMGIVVFP